MICKITGLLKISDSSYSLTLHSPEIAQKSKPGQFIHIKCKETMLLRRPISICNVEDENVRIVVDVRGKGTKWLSERPIGDMLDVLGPLGHGFTIKEGERLLLAGGGVGAPPLLYAARSAVGDAVLGFRSRDSVILYDDFTKHCNNVHICTDDGTVGEHCFVDSLVRKCLKNQKYDRVLTCGPKVMMASVAKAAEEAGIECEVSMEERMGCGVGVCLVCACKTRSDAGEVFSQVCRNGPVYNAKEVCW